MVDEVRAGRVCDSLVMVQGIRLMIADSLIENSGVWVDNLNRQIELWKYQAGNWEAAYGKAVQLGAEEKKEARRRWRRQGLSIAVIAFIGGVFLGSQ